MSIPGIAAKRASDGLSKPLTGDIYVRRWTTKGKGKKPAVEHELRVNAVTAAVAAIGVAAAGLAAAGALWFTQQKIGKTESAKKLVRRVRVYGHRRVPYLIREAYDEPVNDQYVPPHTETEAVIGRQCACGERWMFADHLGEPETGYQHWLYSHRLHGGYTSIAGSITYPGYWTTKIVHHEAEYGYTVEALPANEVRVVVMTQRGAPLKTFTGEHPLTDQMIIGGTWEQWTPVSATETDGWSRLRGETYYYTEHWNTYTHKSKKQLGLSDRKGFSVGGGLLG